MGIVDISFLLNVAQLSLEQYHVYFIEGVSNDNWVHFLIKTRLNRIVPHWHR